MKKIIPKFFQASFTHKIILSNLAWRLKIAHSSLAVSRRGHSSHSDGSCSPVSRLLLPQVVALAVDPANRVVFPAVDEAVVGVPCADPLCSILQLRG